MNIAGHVTYVILATSVEEWGLRVAGRCPSPIYKSPHVPQSHQCTLFIRSSLLYWYIVLIYRVTHEESSIFWEAIVSVILYICPIPNCFRDRAISPYSTLYLALNIDLSSPIPNPLEGDRHLVTFLHIQDNINLEETQACFWQGFEAKILHFERYDTVHDLTIEAIVIGTLLLGVIIYRIYRSICYIVLCFSLSYLFGSGPVF
jgi:hypothetical protein